MSAVLPQLLLVEDSADIRMFMKLVLQSDFDVREAADGPSALHLLETIRPQIIVTDLMMPGMHSRDLLNAFSEKVPQIPVIVLSADKLSIEQLMPLFPHMQFISKPFHPKDLRNAVLQRLHIHSRIPA